MIILKLQKKMAACGCDILEVGAPHLLEMTDAEKKELKRYLRWPGDDHYI